MKHPELREFVICLWKIHILHHAKVEGVIGHHMIQELREHGYDASPGTLYPLLHRMEGYGWLRATSSPAAVHAAQRYEITPEGAELLEKLRGFVAELHRELSSEHEHHQTKVETSVSGISKEFQG